MSTASAIGLSQTAFRTHPATLPLITTSMGLLYAMVQPTIFHPFLRCHETKPDQTSRSTSLWWNHFLPYGLGTILTIGAGNLAGGIYSLRSLPKGSKEYRIAAAGLTFAMAHFAFAPTIARVIENICDEECANKGETIRWQKMWLKIHAWRTAFADIPAVLCFAWLVFGPQ